MFLPALHSLGCRSFDWYSTSACLIWSHYTAAYTCCLCVIHYLGGQVHQRLAYMVEF